MNSLKLSLNLLLAALPLTAGAQLGTWSTNVAIISPARADGAAVVLGGKIYAMGGGNYGCIVFSTLQAYEPTNNTWTTLAPLPTARYEFGAAELNGLIYAVGGNPGCGGPSGLNLVEAYNPVSNTWSNKPTPPTGGYGVSVVSANGKLYQIGGASPSAVYAYDPATNGWAAKAAFPTNNSFCGAAAVDGIIYVIGGSTLGQSSNVYAYNTTNNTWTTRAAMPTARYDAAVGVAGGLIYVAGGVTTSGIHLKAFEIYNPQTDSWATNAPLLVPLVGASGAAISQKFYVIGGYDTNNVTLTTVTVFTSSNSPVSIQVPTNLIAEATSPAGAAVTFTTSATNSSGAVPTTNTPASGSTFPLGTNTVVVTAGAGAFATNKTFTIVVRDTTPPILTLLGANPLTNFLNAPFTDPSATATDTYAGNLTSAIGITGTVNTNVLGSYVLTYTVNDGNGNSAVTNRTVVIVPPPPTLNIASAGSQTAFYWPATATNYVLQTTTNLASTNWVTVTNGKPIIGLTLSNALPAAFFRLQAP